MTPEAQRIAIAEACGWKRCVLDKTLFNGELIQVKGWLRSDGTRYEDFALPLYLTDLNAMHEAEKTLTTQSQRGLYHLNLVHSGSHISDAESLCHATAAQRAEAFLRTIGKWEDDK